jgi:hypothetical protein
MENEKARISFTGIAIGSVALLLAIIHFWAGPFSPQPTLEEAVASKAVAIKDATIAKLKGKEYQPEATPNQMDTDNLLNIFTGTLGGIAIILGVLGFAKKEPLRVAGGAAVLGGGAIAFQFAALALGSIVFAILIMAVLSQIGIG